MFRCALLLLFLSACGGEKDVSFTSEPPRGPSIYLVYEATEATNQRFAVHATGIEAIYGVAFRLGYDSDALRYQTARASADWPADAIALAREAEPGTLWVVWTARGAHDGLANAGKLGEIEFSHTPGASSDLHFRLERSSVFTARGVPVRDVAWLGGELVAP